MTGMEIKAKAALIRIASVYWDDEMRFERIRHQGRIERL